MHLGNKDATSTYEVGISKLCVYDRKDYNNSCRDKCEKRQTFQKRLFINTLYRANDEIQSSSDYLFVFALSFVIEWLSKMDDNEDCAEQGSLNDNENPDDIYES